MNIGRIGASLYTMLVPNQHNHAFDSISKPCHRATQRVLLLFALLMRDGISRLQSLLERTIGLRGRQGPAHGAVGFEIGYWIIVWAEIGEVEIEARRDDIGGCDCLCPFPHARSAQDVVTLRPDRSIEQEVADGTEVVMGNVLCR